MKKFKEQINSFYYNKTFDEVILGEALRKKRDFIPGGYQPPGIEEVKTDPSLDTAEIPEVSHKTLNLTLDVIWNNKLSGLIYGRPGVGKSQAVKKYVKEKAETMPQSGENNDPNVNRIFVEFSSLIRKSTKEGDITQEDVLNNPGKYFVLIDVRAASFEPADFMGIPAFDEIDGQMIRTINPTRDEKGNMVSEQPKAESDIEKLRTVKYKWAYLSTHPEAAGFLFLDEVNQAHLDVLKAMYMVILDRVIFDQKISPNIAIVAAGNLAAQDPHARNVPLPKALSRRFQQGGVVSLVTSRDEWLEWAIEEGIHPSIISYIMSTPASSFYAPPDDERPNDRFADPDSLKSLSTYFYGVDRKIDKKDNFIREYDRIARSVTGNEWAAGFIKFLKEHANSELLEKSKLVPKQKWTFLYALQRSVLNVFMNDPNLEKPESAAALKFAANKISTLPDELRITFTKSLKNNRSDDIRNTFNLMQSKGEEIAEADESSNEIQKVFDMGASYTSQFEAYHNEEEETNLLKVDHNTVIETLEHGWEEREPVLIYGDAGVGKSWAVKKFAKLKAKELGYSEEEFIDINDLPSNQARTNAVTQGNKVFLFFDVRVAGMTEQDFMGIPNIIGSETEYLTTKKLFWAWAVTQPNVIGILFLDEINQANEQVKKALYSVINPSDRMIFDTHISDDIMIVGAGNLPSQDPAAENEPLSAALNRRFKAGTVVLDIDVTQWLNWAEYHGVHPVILEFIRTRDNPESYLFKKSVNIDTADLNPDTLVSLSNKMKRNEAQYEEDVSTLGEEQATNLLTKRWNHAIQTTISPWWGREFIGFLYYTVHMDWDRVLELKTLFSDRNLMRQHAQETGENVMEIMLATFPLMKDELKRILTNDPGIEQPENISEVTEILDVVSSFDKTNFAVFTSYLKKANLMREWGALLKKVLSAQKVEKINLIDQALQAFRNNDKFSPGQIQLLSVELNRIIDDSAEENNTFQKVVKPILRKMLDLNVGLIASITGRMQLTDEQIYTGNLYFSSRQVYQPPEIIETLNKAINGKSTSNEELMITDEELENLNNYYKISTKEFKSVLDFYSAHNKRYAAKEKTGAYPPDILQKANAIFSQSMALASKVAAAKKTAKA